MQPFRAGPHRSTQLHTRPTSAEANAAEENGGGDGGVGGSICQDWAVMPPRPALALIVLAALTAASCGEIPEPEGFTIATATTAREASDATAVVEEAATEVRSAAPVTTEFVPTRDEDYVPEVLISTASALLSADGDGLRPLGGSYAGLSTARAVDDLLGGLVVEHHPLGDLDEQREVIWYPAQGKEPVIVDDAGARLLDVGYVGGSPTAVVLVGAVQIDRIRLVDNERTPMITLGESEELLSLSASGGFNAMVLANEQCGDLRFYTADGTLIDRNGPGEPNCIVPRRPAYGAVALSPAGGAMVYTAVRYRDDGIEVRTDLVARELDSGDEYYRRTIGRDGDRITALSFDGERVAYLRQSDTVTAVSVLDLSADTETPIDLEGVGVVDSISFARLPLASDS